MLAGVAQSSEIVILPDAHPLDPLSPGEITQSGVRAVLV
jgi:hypothetical protein